MSLRFRLVVRPFPRWPLAALAGLFVAASLTATEIPWGDPILAGEGYPGVANVDVADIDRDGIPDLVAAAADSTVLAWFRHFGNGVFAPKVIAGVVELADVEVADLDGDGDPDVVAITGGTTDTVGWYENDGTPLDGGWSLHVIGTGFDEGSHLAVADLDRDGDLDVAATAGLEAGGAVAVALNADGLGTSWTSETVDTSFTRAFWVVTGDIDGDGVADLAGSAFGDDDVLGGVAWWRREPGDGTWTRNVVAWPVPRAGAVALCDFDRDGDLDLAGTSSSGVLDSVAWWENGSWAARPVAAGLGALSLEAADLDRDGDCDLLYGALANDSAGWLENRDGVGDTWTVRPLPLVADGAFAFVPGDLDRDGDPDVALALATPGELAVFANLTIHRDAVFPDLVGLGLGGATRSLATGDLDGDGDDDLLGGSSSLPDLLWWENQGAAASWAKESIDDAFVARAVAVADLDDDLRNDAIAAGPAGLHWWRSYEGTWTEYPLATDIASPGGVLVGDLDRDGDLDLVLASQTGGVSWLENTRDAVDFPESDIATPFLADSKALALADLDRDGDLDLVVGMLAGISWYRNDLSSGGGFAAAASIAADLGQPRSVALGDFDRDGDLDVAAVEASDGTASWWANLAGDASAWGAAQPIAAGVDEPRVLVLADFDLDGDLDVALGAENGTTHASFAAWYENAGFGLNWTAHTISTSALQPNALLAPDLDGDGDADLAFGGLAGAPVWLPNRGGQAGVATAVTAPLQLPPGARDDVLAIDVTHLGRPFDADARALEVALRFTDPALAPLTSEKLDALLVSLSFYVDDGDGYFEPATELLLRQVTAFELVDGGESYPLADAPQLEVGAGESCRIFVALEFAAGAPDFEPNALHVVHREAISLVEDRSAGIPLSIEDPDEVATPLILAVPALIFADGFESGDSTAWDLDMP